MSESSPINGSEIAIIGLAGRFPGAQNLDLFWQNLQNGVESISFFTDEELRSAGVDSALLSDPNFVKAHGFLEDVELFDAAFFGFNPREAEITDPQHRLFLECAWEALENAGYDSETYAGSIGVYAGSSSSSYLLNIFNNKQIFNSVDSHQLAIANDKDYLATRVSYKLNLTGSSYTVQTACSTSLVAVHLACQSLLNGECDMALAGGVSISSTRKNGYLYTEGGINSPDGHCRAFDAKAKGTVGGEGVGIAVLKRLEDAIADGDSIRAIIKGSAIDNDGSLKVSYTAPSIDGQARAIRTAQMLAEVEPETITYIEAHGTGTPLGDPIEIAALTQAFRAGTQKKGFCAIGSLKTNIGHLDAAAGIAGLIKTVLALQHQQIPPSLHFEQPNPQINFADSPFYVNSSLQTWESNGVPRRAGVSSFGIGGTNVHVILEEFHAKAQRRKGAGGAGEAGEELLNNQSSIQNPTWQLLISAKTASALEVATDNLAAYLDKHSELDLADVAYTLAVGRRAFDCRRMVVCTSRDDAVQALQSLDRQRVFSYYQKPCHRSVVFMFSPQGSQYVNMGRELYLQEPIFAAQIDRAAELLKPLLGLDLRHILYPNAAEEEEAQKQIDRTAITQPALFAIEYALAQLWMSWGVRPEAAIGHSIGEYVAATIAGVFSLEDALRVVATRGRLMQQLPPGAMISVPLSEFAIEPFLATGLSLAGSNGPSSCVVSGTIKAIAILERQLQEKDIGYRRLRTSHAFHSQMMDAIVEPFIALLEQIELHPPQIPFISNLTGTWITSTQATDPNYWASHLRQPVRFSEGIAELVKQPERILLEVGPGRSLSTFAKQHQQDGSIVLTSLRHPQEQQSDAAFLLNTLGRLWLAGNETNWSHFYNGEKRDRVPLPTYPFERQRYWIDLPTDITIDRKSDIADWFYIPSWKRTLPPRFQAQAQGCWLLFVDECGLGEQIARTLTSEGREVITVKTGAQFDRISDRSYQINPRQQGNYQRLFKELLIFGKQPSKIIYLWSVTPNFHSESSEELEFRCFYSLLFLVQAIADRNLTDALEIAIVSNHLQEVTGSELLCPEKALLLGPCQVIPLEYPHITCRSIDLVFPHDDRAISYGSATRIAQLLAELTSQTSDRIVAYRDRNRWVQDFEPVRLEATDNNPRLRQEGVYLITGGLGGVGLALAEYLAETVQAKLILIGRSPELAPHQIEKIRAIESLGAEVMVVTADVVDLEQMSAAINKATQRFGQIHGVIHAAAVPGGGTIQLATPETTASALAPKVRGTRVLDSLFKDVPLDFLFLFSSINAYLGAAAMVDYTAANAFLDAFARYQSVRNDKSIISINWDRWANTGMAVAVQTRYKEITGEELTGGMTVSEAIAAFKRILASNTVPQIVVSTEDFQARCDRNQIQKSWEEQFAEAKHSRSTHCRPDLENAYIAPSNEIEHTIADLWQELLGIERVGINDNFFELGGDSLFATILVARLGKIFPVELSYKSFFDRPTVADLADAIAQNKKVDANKEIKPQNRDTNALPLSFAQQRLWFLDRLQPGTTAYHIFHPLRVTGTLNVSALEGSFQAIIKRHEILRTTFIEVDGQPFQAIADNPTFSLPIVDLQELPFEDREAEILRLATQEAQQPFDLAKGSLIRVTLLKLAEAEYVVFLTMHHIIADGWSVGVLVREMESLYKAFCNGNPSTLPDLPIQYADFAVWQRNWLQGEQLETQLTYWKQQLAGELPILNLPTDRPRSTVQTFGGARQDICLSKEISEQLKHLNRREGITLFMTLLAALQTLLYWYTSQEDIIIGTDIANRNQVEVTGLIGFFVNQLVLRANLSGNPTFQELLERVRDMTLDAYAYQDLPFDKLVDALKPKRQLNRAPLFQVKLIWENTQIPSLELADLSIAPLQHPKTTTQLDLILELMETDRGIEGALEYSTDLFEATTIDRILEHFQTLLAEIVKRPQARLNKLLTILTEADRKKRREQFQHKLTQVKRKTISI